jgi:hypothetical protein
VFVDRPIERWEVVAHRDYVQVGLWIEQALNAFSHEKIVLAKDNPNRHGTTIRGDESIARSRGEVPGSFVSWGSLLSLRVRSNVAVSTGQAEICRHSLLLLFG